MMIIMQPGASQEQIGHVIELIEAQRLSSHTIVGVEQTIIGAVGESHDVPTSVFETLPGVLECGAARELSRLHTVRIQQVQWPERLGMQPSC